MSYFVSKEILDEVVSMMPQEFYVKKETITSPKGNKYTVYMYDYQSGFPKYFERHPYARELRGITVIIDDSGREYIYPAVPKFFNIDQYEKTSYDILKDKPVHGVFVKEDGSMLMPLILPDDSLVFKTKVNFRAKQVQRAMEYIRKHPEYEEFIREVYEKGYMPLFEFVSPINRLTVPYNTEDLIFIMARDFCTGHIVAPSQLWDITSKYDIKTPADELSKYPDIPSLVAAAKTVEGIEGWVVYVDGKLVKVKTDWYLNKAGVKQQDKRLQFTKWVLNDKADDFLSKMQKDSDTYRYLIYVGEVLTNALSAMANQIVKIYSEPGKTRKEIAIQYRNELFFEPLMRLYVLYEKGEPITVEKAYKTIKQSWQRMLKKEKGRNKLFTQLNILPYEEFILKQQKQEEDKIVNETLQRVNSSAEKKYNNKGLKFR